MQETGTARVLRAMEHGSASVRLEAALAAGTTPDPGLVDTLVARCGLEPDFFVRDMLTWALTRHEPALTVPRVVGELGSPRPQARAQALHTLSKIGDRRAWPAITRALLTDADDDVARSAWRAAAVLVPEEGRTELAAVLATQLGRGGRETQLSLSRALVALGEAVLPVLDAAERGADPGVRRHADATRRLLLDPDAGSGYAVEEAKRIVALGPAGREG
ncbi:HEAT repeat domain-containing protein [Dactylosporangium aurantiacum]|uniref:HEAT repeat domain-containing protein n=2 Tax=Dactylosporangium aurantiacum TaxID=35754 RepID=A0A9Q9IUS5_9ACTN|nr:HEAT repeat domain-containing protein [Dactylosporangium aurantiacum]